MKSDRFDHIFLQPSSFEASFRHYHDVLGWQVEQEWGGAGAPRGVCLSSAGMSIVLAEPHSSDDHSQTDGVQGTRPTVHLRVDDLDARYAELKNTGTVLFPPEPTHWGSRWFVARDPDGNLIAFEQPVQTTAN